MDYFEFLNRTHELLKKQLEARPLDAELKALNAETRARLLALTPITFTEISPGFLVIGIDGHERTISHPGIDGLDNAWQIFLHGATAGAALHAAGLVGGASKTPGTTLEKRLSDAATWAEREARCPELAQIIKSISVSRLGEITFNPARCRPLKLFI
jgi:hypothetical protein